MNRTTAVVTGFLSLVLLSPQITVGQESDNFSLPEIVPPSINGDRQTIPLPAPVTALDMGGGGRFLVLYFEKLRRIAIFDVNELKITGYISASDANTKFAAGANKLIVVSGTSGMVARYDLLTRQKELERKINIDGQVAHVVLGSASNGPALVSGTAPRRGGQSGALELDLQSLKTSPLQIDNNRLSGFGRNMEIRMAANGNMMVAWPTRNANQGQQTIVKTGTKWTGYYERQSLTSPAPSPDGRYIFSPLGLFTNQLRLLTSTRNNYTGWIPATQGPCYLSVVAERGGAEKVFLKMVGNDQLRVPVSNLAPLFEQRRQDFTLDQRLFLIPAAKLVLQLGQTADKLFVVPLDIESALQDSGIDYLYVPTSFPQHLNAGAEWQYQIEAKSTNGPITYSLDSGPPGMQLSPTGMLTWKPTASSPAHNHVIVKVADSSDRRVFHLLDIHVHGGNQNADDSAYPSDPSPLSADPTDNPDIPAAGDQAHEIPLPGIVTDAVVGGRGRYLLIHMNGLNKIAVLDVSRRRIVHYLPAHDPQTVVVAGATRALVFSLSRRVVSRYRLDTLERELTADIPFPNPTVCGMGADAESAVLLRWSEDTKPQAPSQFAFLDVNTLRPLEIEWPENRSLRPSYRDTNSIHTSTSGRVFAVTRVGVLRLGGQTVKFQKSDFVGIPSADGQYFLQGGRILDSDLQPVTRSSGRFDAAIPSVAGPYFLGFQRPTSGGRNAFRQAITKHKAELYMLGEDRRLATLPDVLATSTLFSAGHNNPLGLEKRVFLVPDAKLIVTVPVTNDRIRLLPFDIDQALQASGWGYLFVDSHAPDHAALGAVYEYPISVKSKAGDIQFSLDDGPQGMTLSSDGKISWPVPEQLDEMEATAIVSISDASGQTIFHTFSIEVPKVAAEGTFWTGKFTTEPADRKGWSLDPNLLHNMSPEVAIALVIIGLIVLMFDLVLTLTIIFLLRSLLKALPEQYRLTSPGMAWLLLIPCFNFLWNFVVFPRVGKSYHRFFRAHGRTDVGNGPTWLAYTFSVCLIIASIPTLNLITILISAFCIPVALFMLLLYFVKLFRLRSQIPTMLNQAATNNIAPAGDVDT